MMRNSIVSILMTAVFMLGFTVILAQENSKKESKKQKEHLIYAGFETTDPFNRQRWVIIESAAETDEYGWVLELHIPEGTPPTRLEHLHLTWTETFEILQGTASYKIDGVEYTANVGDTFVVPPSVLHLHPWNTGTGTMIYRQTTDFGKKSPGAVDNMLGTFATLHGLGREGKIGDDGLPKNFWQRAVTIRTLTKLGNFDEGASKFKQRLFGTTIGNLARLFGYRSVYARYIRSSEED